MAQEETERPRTSLLGKCNLGFHNGSFSKPRALGLWKLSPDLRISLGRKEKQAFFVSWKPKQADRQEKGCWWTSAALPLRQAKPRGLEWTRMVSLVQKGRPCQRLRRWASTPWGTSRFFMKPPKCKTRGTQGPAGQKHAPCPEKWPRGGQQGRGWSGGGPIPPEAPWQGWEC